jgi:hypothetical protein
MSELEWIEFESSTVESAAFDAERDIIYVRFRGGGTYAYDECPPHVWEAFVAPGQSAGKYVNETLRHKPYQKVEI